MSKIPPITPGVFSLLGAIIQCRLMLERLEQGSSTYQAPQALTMVVAILFLVIGLFSLVVIAVG